MNYCKAVLIGLCFSLGFIFTNSHSAQAQLGIGIGLGPPIGGAPIMGMWAAGQYFGAGVDLSPLHTNGTAPGYLFERQKDSPKRASATSNLTGGLGGTLIGYLRICSTQENTPAGSVSQPAKGAPSDAATQQLASVCAPNTTDLKNAVVTATPLGLSQWIATKPDAQGQYQFILTPGNYLIKAEVPGYPALQPQTIIIKPNQITHQDLWVSN